MTALKEFHINESLSLKLEENGKKNVYVKNKIFINCKRVFISMRVDHLKILLFWGIYAPDMMTVFDSYLMR